MISSTANVKVKNIVHLKKNARARREQNCFLVEGPRMFFEVPLSRLREVYLTEEFEQKYEDRLVGYSYEKISENVCRHLSDTKTPQGVIAVVDREEMTLDALLKKEAHPCFLLLENIQDPGNLGTMFRTGEGAGITGIIMNKETVDPYSPKVIRSTMGAIFRLPFYVAENFQETVRQLKTSGVTVCAAHLDGEVFYDCDYRQSCAFLIGNEGNGLTAETAALADRKILIPMKGKVESLNAAVASTVLMYEVLRQREWSPQ